MTTDLGTDFDCLDDFRDDFGLTSGAGGVRQDAYHRLITNNLVDVDGFGKDVSELLATVTDQASAAALQPAIDSVLQQNPRVLQTDTVCTLVPTDDPSEPELRIDIHAETREGPFDLVLAVSSVDTKILEAVPPPDPAAPTPVEPLT